MSLPDLSESDYAKIGKLLKARFGKWQNNTDVEVGVVHYTRGEVPADILTEIMTLDIAPTFAPSVEVDFVPLPALNTKPWFPSFSADYREQVSGYISACYNQEATERRLAFENAHFDENLRRGEYLRWIQHIQAVVLAKATIVTTQAQTKLTIQQAQVASFLIAEAAKHGQDLITYIAFGDEVRGVKD